MRDIFIFLLIKVAIPVKFVVNWTRCKFCCKIRNFVPYNIDARLGCAQRMEQSILDQKLLQQLTSFPVPQPSSSFCHCDNTITQYLFHLMIILTKHSSYLLLYFLFSYLPVQLPIRNSYRFVHEVIFHSQKHCSQFLEELPPKLLHGLFWQQGLSIMKGK